MKIRFGKILLLLNISIIFLLPKLLTASEAIGELRFAIVCLDYVNDGTAPSLNDVEDGIFNVEHSVANFIEASSYGKTTIIGDIFGWIIPPNPLYGQGWTSCWPVDQDRFNLLLDNYPNVDLTAYDGFLFYVYRGNVPGCTAGVANTFGLEPRETYTQFGVIETRIAYFTGTFYFPYEFSRITNSTVAHELIHTLGISNHSNSYTCGDKILSTDPADCTINAYGDLFCIMGLRSQASHPNATNKERLGWIDTNAILDVSQSGQYTINSYEDQISNLKALVIYLENPIPISNLQADYLYIEYRAMTGFDERDSLYRNIRLKDGTTFTIDNIHGALIHVADCSTYDYCIPYLLNMHPNSIDASYPSNEVANANLHLGESFEVPLNNITIDVIAVDEGDSLTVNVVFHD